MSRKGTNPTPKRAVTRNRDWTEPFLLALAESGNVTVACSEAAVDRTTAYERKNEDVAFAAKWRAALNEAADLLEAEARRRAHHGVDEPVIHQGELCGTWVNPETGETTKPDADGAKFIPLTIKKYSDTLMIFLLKGIRPKKFRDNLNVKHTGSIKHLHKVKPAMQRMRGRPEAFRAARLLHEQLTKPNDN